MFYHRGRFSRRSLLYDFPPEVEFSPFISYAKRKGLEIIELYSPMKSSFPEDTGKEEDLKLLVKDYYGEEEFVFFPSYTSMLLSLLWGITDVGDEILAPEPFPWELRWVCLALGITPVPVETSITNGWRLPLRDRIEKKISSRTRAIFFSSPQHLTGTVYTDEEKERLIFITRNYNLYLLVDRTFAEFGEEKEMPGMQDVNAVILDGFTRKFGEEGLSLLFTKNHYLLRLVSEITSILLPFRFISGKWLKMLAGAREALEEERKRVEELNEKIYEEVGKRSEIFSIKSEGWREKVIGLPVEDTSRFCEFLLEEFSRDEKTLFLAPMRGMYPDKEKGRNEVLLRVFLEAEKLEEAFSILDEAIEKYGK